MRINRLHYILFKLNKMNIIPLGPIVPKKPKPKGLQINFNGDLVLGWIDADSQPTQGNEVFSFDGNEFGIPNDGIYILTEYSYSIELINGIIQ